MGGSGEREEEEKIMRSGDREGEGVVGGQGSRQSSKRGGRPPFLEQIPFDVVRKTQIRSDLKTTTPSSSMLFLARTRGEGRTEIGFT